MSAAPSEVVRRLASPTGEAGVFACLAAVYLVGLVVDARVATLPGIVLALVVVLYGALGVLLPLEGWSRLAPLVYVALSFVPQGIALTVLHEPPQTFALFVFAPFVWAGVHRGRHAVVQLLPVALLCTFVPTVIVDRTTSGVVAVAIAIGGGMWVGVRLAAVLRHRREVLERALEAERTRAAVTRAFAHDVAQPLTVISGNLDLLERHEQIAAGERRRLLAGARRHAARLSSLATALLDVDRVQHGQLRLDRVSVDLESAITHAARLADVDVDVVIAADAGTVDADPGRLEQVLVNLLSNARRHGRPPVTVSVVAQEGATELRVRDHGPGIAPERIDAAFEPFRPVEQAGSNGLGLSIVRALVQAHGWTVRADLSDPGLEVVVTLPGRPSG